MYVYLKITLGDRVCMRIYLRCALETVAWLGSNTCIRGCKYLCKGK